MVFFMRNEVTTPVCRCCARLMWIMSRGENFEGIEATWDKACSSSTYDNDGGDGADDDGIYYDDDTV